MERNIGGVTTNKKHMVAEHAMDSADDGDIVNNGTYINIMFMLHVHMGYLYD